MEDKIFKNDAKQIVDLMHNTKMFKEDVTRDNMNEMEQFVQFLLQSRFESYQKMTKLLERLAKK